MTPTLLPAVRPELHSELTGRILGAAIEVHRSLGPGLLMHAYDACFAHELASRGLAFVRQQPVPIHYRGRRIDAAVRPDMVVAGEVIVEHLAVDRLLPMHEAQLLTYLRLTRLRVGLLINFHAPLLKHGVRRLQA
ncbi:MAG: GxxExxY protein [Planctomycetota bacterium]|jgi:GxxExxY protein